LGWCLGEKATDVNLLLAFSVKKFKDKTKSSGLPDSNFIFFIAIKKTKQKKAWRCAGHVWLDIAATSIQDILTDQQTTLPAQDPRLLRASPVVEDCKVCHVF
jgi:hypothetical protein